MNLELKLLKSDDPFLHKKIEIYNGEYGEYLKNISDAMIALMIEHHGIGLAASQVGIDIRMFVMGSFSVGFYVIINPQIINTSSTNEIMEEGCLTFPNKTYNIRRPTIINVEYTDINGKLIKETFKDIWARCFLHELDHLDGITFDYRKNYEN